MSYNSLVIKENPIHYIFLMIQGRPLYIVLHLNILTDDQIRFNL